MRRFLTRALGALSLSVLLAAGVGATAAAADTPSSSTAASTSHAQTASDWWA